MVVRVKDQVQDGRDDVDPPETGQPKRADRGPENGAEPPEHQKAETEIAAGDVADDLADFA